MYFPEPSTLMWQHFVYYYARLFSPYVRLCLHVCLQAEMNGVWIGYVRNDARGKCTFNISWLSNYRCKVWLEIKQGSDLLARCKFCSVARQLHWNKHTSTCADCATAVVSAAHSWCFLSCHLEIFVNLAETHQQLLDGLLCPSCG